MAVRREIPELCFWGAAVALSDFHRHHPEGRGGLFVCCASFQESGRSFNRGRSLRPTAAAECPSGGRAAPLRWLGQGKSECRIVALSRLPSSEASVFFCCEGGVPPSLPPRAPFPPSPCPLPLTPPSQLSSSSPAKGAGALPLLAPSIPFSPNKTVQADSRRGWCLWSSAAVLDCLARLFSTSVPRELGTGSFIRRCPWCLVGGEPNLAHG